MDVMVYCTKFLIPPLTWTFKVENDLGSHYLVFMIFRCMLMDEG